MDEFLVLKWVFAAIIVVAIFKGARTVEDGYEQTVERFGQYLRTLKPGFHIIFPFVDRISYMINMMEQSVEIAADQYLTNDNQRVSFSMELFFQITDSKKIAYENPKVKELLSSSATRLIKQQLDQMDAAPLMSDRGAFIKSITNKLQSKVKDSGVNVTRVDIGHISTEDAP